MHGVTVRVAVFVTPPATAVIVASVARATLRACTGNVAEVALAGTVTLAATVATAVLELLRATMAPPAGAGPLSVTVPVENDPPTTVVGARATLLSAPTAATVSTAVLVTGPETAEIVAVVVFETATVVIWNVADAVPTPTVTDAGRVATELSELSVTTFPPVGAWPLSVTVPVEGLPPIRLDGASVRVVNAAGATVRNALFVTPPEMAETVTVVVEETGRLVMVKVPVFKPAVTVKVAGTVAAEVLELCSVTTVPPAGALPTRVTVPVAVPPLMTVLGAIASALTAASGMTVRT